MKITILRNLEKKLNSFTKKTGDTKYNYIECVNKLTIEMNEKCTIIKCIVHRK